MRNWLSALILAFTLFSAPLLASTTNGINTLPAVSTGTYPQFERVSLLQMLLNGAGVDGWHQYARHQLTPDFLRIADAPLPQSLVSFVIAEDQLLTPGFVSQWRFDDRSAVTFSMRTELISSDTPIFQDSLTFLDGAGLTNGLEQTIFAPGFTTGINERTSVGVAAVIAYQQFASWGMGSFTSDQLMGDFATAALGSEQSYGAGVSIGLSSEINPWLRFGASIRSEIDMDAFSSYQGVYSEPGDFDIPASAMIGFQLDATPTTHFMIDVERVMYSDVDTFTSDLLPDRFLSLLGDSTSPVFAWDDLTIYRVGWAWDAQKDLTWRVNYSTRRQPAPTSDLLQLALSPEFADDNYTVGFTKYTERLGRFNFNAHYSPTYLYTGSAFQPRDFSDQIEVEALWIFDF